MKFNVFILCVFMILSNLSYAQIVFEKSWESAQSRAKQEKKHIFVDAYADWCGPCKQMAKEVFTDVTVGEFYNTNFISVKIDMEKEGTAFASKYSVDAYPTLIYFDADLKVVNKNVGSLGVSQFLNLGRRIVQKSPELETAKTNFKKDPKDAAFAKAYMYEFLKTNDMGEASNVAQKYLNNIPQEQHITAENLEFLYFAALKKTKYLDYAYQNREKVLQIKSGEIILKQLILEVYTPDLKEAFAVKEEVIKKVENIKTKIQKKYPIDAPAINAKIDMVYAQNFEGDNMFKYMDIYYSKYCVNSKEINASISNFLQSPKDNALILQKIKVWSERVESMEKNTSNMLNTVDILKRLGYKKEALAKAEEAKSIAKNAQETKQAEKYIQELK